MNVGTGIERFFWVLATSVIAACGSVEPARVSYSWREGPSGPGSTRWSEHIVLNQSTTMTVPGSEPEVIRERNATVDCIVSESEAGRRIEFSEFSLDGTDVSSHSVPSALEVHDGLRWNEGEPSSAVAEVAAMLFDPRLATVDDTDDSYTAPHTSGEVWSVPAGEATAVLAARNCANTPEPGDARASILGPSSLHPNHVDIESHLEFPCDPRERPPGPVRSRLVWTHRRTVPIGSGPPAEDVSTTAIEATLVGGGPSGEDVQIVFATSVRRTRGLAGP